MSDKGNNKQGGNVPKPSGGRRKDTFRESARDQPITEVFDTLKPPPRQPEKPKEK